MEMKRLQQHEPNRQRESTLTGSVLMSPITVCSSSPPPSTPVSCSASASSSLPFELPDVNISDLLTLTIQSPKNFQSSLIDYRRTPSTSLSVSASTSASLPASAQRPSCTDRSKKQKDVDNKKKVKESCRQNNMRNIDINRTANGNKPSVAMTGDSRKRPAHGHCTLAGDSDDEFEDLHCSNVAKKRAEQKQYVDSKADARSVAAGEIIHKPDVESSSKQDRTDVVTDVTDPHGSLAAGASSIVSDSVAVDSGSVQQKVAQRLSKFAFNDSLLRQRQESPADGSVTCVKSHGLQGTQHSIGNSAFFDCFLSFVSACMCWIFTDVNSWFCIT